MNCQSKVCLNNLLARSTVIKQWSYSSFSSDEGRRLTRNEIKYFSSILGVPVNASEDRIKQAFYMKSKESHPDVNKEKGSSKLFSEITQAYKALVHDKKFSQSSLKNDNFQNISTHIRPWVQPRKKKKESNSNRAATTVVDDNFQNISTHIRPWVQPRKKKK